MTIAPDRRGEGLGKRGLSIMRQVAAEAGQAGTLVTLFPDNAYKYLSESFWTK